MASVAAPARWPLIARLIAVATMSAVHEAMQKWTGEEYEEKRQNAEEVSPMLRLQEETGDEEEAHRGHNYSSRRCRIR